MNDLTARIESLLRRYASVCDQDGGDSGRLWEAFRKELQMLVAEFGPRAVDAALDELPDAASPSASLH